MHRGQHPTWVNALLLVLGVVYVLWAARGKE